PPIGGAEPDGLPAVLPLAPVAAPPPLGSGDHNHWTGESRLRSYESVLFHAVKMWSLPSAPVSSTADEEKNRRTWDSYILRSTSHRVSAVTPPRNQGPHV
ncbi:hypothetical protein GOODEAATRI_023314, partial [Goodea atripinnis]